MERRHLDGSNASRMLAFPISSRFIEKIHADTSTALWRGWCSIVQFCVEVKAVETALHTRSRPTRRPSWGQRWCERWLFALLPGSRNGHHKFVAFDEQTWFQAGPLAHSFDRPVNASAVIGDQSEAIEQGINPGVARHVCQTEANGFDRHCVRRSARRAHFDRASVSEMADSTW